MSNVVEKFNLSSLKMITYGTEPMQESLLLRLGKVFPKVRFLQTFGTSETGILQTSSRSSDSLQMKFDDPNQEHKIVEGELWLRSKTQVLGYINANMESFTSDGWFRTGDIVEEHEEGFLKICGRNKEIVNVGGEKVFPAEVESILLGMELVADALVHGEPNAITGQSVVAEIVLGSDLEKREAKKQIKKYCRERLAGYKVPTKLIFKQRTDIGDRFKKMRIKRQ
jgi:acyl-CoA synthetase (AMP-forming)/AMP-acid ligase II